MNKRTLQLAPVVVLICACSLWSTCRVPHTFASFCECVGEGRVTVAGRVAHFCFARTCIDSRQQRNNWGCPTSRAFRDVGRETSCSGLMIRGAGGPSFRWHSQTVGAPSFAASREGWV